MESTAVRLHLTSAHPVGDEALSRDLRAALLELPEVAAVTPATRPATEGDKGTPVDWNTLLLTWTASGGVLTTLITAIQSWVQTRKEVRVTLEIDGDTLTIEGRGPYSKEQQTAIDLFLARHRGYRLPRE